MSREELFAWNIVKGEANGDEFIEDYETYDPDTGVVSFGAWKSQIEKIEKDASVATNVREYTPEHDNAAI